MLGYYAIYASPAGQRMIRNTQDEGGSIGLLPHQIAARNAVPKGAGWFGLPFIRYANRIA